MYKPLKGTTELHDEPSYKLSVSADAESIIRAAANAKNFFIKNKNGLS
jgi:hypothetical protein